MHKMKYLIALLLFPALLTACGKPKPEVQTTQLGDYTVEISKTDSSDKQSFELINDTVTMEYIGRDDKKIEYFNEHMDEFIKTEHPENITVTVKKDHFSEDPNIYKELYIEFKDQETGQREYMNANATDTIPPKVTIKNNELICYLQSIDSCARGKIDLYDESQCDFELKNVPGSHLPSIGDDLWISADDISPDLIPGNYDHVVIVTDQGGNQVEIPITVRLLDEPYPSSNTETE